MERMEHARGKLLHGETTLLNSVDYHIGAHIRSKGHPSYFGFFEATAEDMARVEEVGCGPFHIALDDGRGGDIYVTIHPTTLPGRKSADFHIQGELTDGRHRARRLGR